MNKRVLFILLFLIFPLISIIPPVVLATPSVTVLSPNGGEVLSGNTSIIISINDPVIPPTDILDANFFISVSPDLNGTFVSQDVNLLNVCEFDSGDGWKEKTPFDLTFATSGIDRWQNSVMFFFESAYHAIIFSFDDPKSGYGFTWNGSAWDFDGDWNAGLDAAANTMQGAGTAFVLDGSLYLLYGESDLDRAWIYNTVTDQWDSDTGNIDSGIPAHTENYNSAYYVFDFQGALRLIQEESRSNPASFFLTFHRSYTWTGSTWNQDDLYIKDFNAPQGVDGSAVAENQFYGDVFVEDDTLYALLPNWCVSRTESCPDSLVLGRRWDGGKWIADFDINAGLPSSQDANRWFVEYIDWDGVPTLFQFSINPTTAEDSFIGDRYEESTIFKTGITKECAIDLDTTLYPDGTYFIDVSVVNEYNEKGNDSSDSAFSIVNWDSSEVACECISNCTSCILDVNTFVVTPTNEQNDVVYKISNFTGAKTIGNRLLNSNNSGKQYKVFVATEADFGDGIWNFSDTLSFGSTTNNAVQKIWQNTTEEYRYFFSDLFTNDEVQYFKLDYFEPAFHFPTLETAVWDNQFSPSVQDLNGLITDIFSVSTFSNMASLLTEPEFPSIISNSLENVNYVLQFTSRADAFVSGELNAGSVLNRSATPGTSLDLTTSYTTLTVTGLNGGFMKIQSAASTGREFWFQNYAILERGFFVKSLEVFDSDGSELPVMIGDANSFSQYVVEGGEFMVNTAYLDPDGVIDRYEVTAYIDSVDITNKLKRWTFDVSEEEGLVQLTPVLDGLIDLTADAPDRIVKLTLRLVDTNAQYYEIQSKTFSLRQFPSTTLDLFFNIRIDNKKIGDHPKGRITLDTIAPENIIGVEFNIQDNTDNNVSDFNKIFYKDQDFSCNAFDCSFDFEIEEYIFPSSDFYRVEGWVLVKTEEKGTKFSLLHKLLIVPVTWITFDTARIFQVAERTDRTYRNDEILPLVVQLRDSTGGSLRDSIHLFMQLQECNAADAGRCRFIDLNYAYDSFLYDISTGYNYYFFRQLFVEEDFTKLSDGNYFRFRAFIEDPNRVHQTLYQPVLADKCQDPDPLTFYLNMLTMNFFNQGCTSAQFTDEIVSFPDTNSHEARILIDADHVTGSPTQYWWQCTSPDQNNLYEDVLAQDIICSVFYLIKEKPIDKFRITIANENSRMSEKRDEFKQFIELEVPFELIYANDLGLMKQSMEKNFSTDSIDTVGEMIQAQANFFLGALSPAIKFTGDGLLSTGLINNVGFNMGFEQTGNDLNFNFNTLLDPNNVSGILTYRIRNLNIINKNDYETLFPLVKSISASRFIEYADSENIRVSSDPVMIDVFISDMKKVISKEIDSKLVIDEDLKQNRVNVQNADINSVIQFPSLPSRLRFIVTTDMIYNNEQLFKRLYLILPYTVILDSEDLCGLFGVGCWFNDEEGSAGAIITKGDLSFFIINWFGLLAFISAVILISIAYTNFRKNGGITVNLPFRK